MTATHTQPATVTARSPGSLEPGALAGWLLIVGLCVLAYLPVAGGGFIWDDDVLLTHNPIVQSPQGLKYIWFSTRSFDYYPVTWSVLWLLWQTFGPEPAAYHVVNILLHSLAAGLVWRVLRLLGVRGAFWGALLFALHPVNVASVAWIAEIKNTLSLALAAAATIAFLHAATPVEQDLRGRRNWYVVSLLLFGLAVLSKASVVVLPPMLGLLLWWRQGQLQRHQLIALAGWLLIAGGQSVATIWFQTVRAIGSDLDPRPEGLIAQLATVGWAWWFYLYKALLPIDLSIVYPRWAVNPSVPLTWVPNLMLAILLMLTWARRERWGRLWPTLAGCYTLALLPVLGLVKMSYMRFSLAADHWQYLAIIVPCALVGCVLAQLQQRRPRWGWLAGGVVIVLLAATSQRAGLYHDSFTLWSAHLVDQPGSALGHNNLGVELDQQGRRREALEHFQQAVALDASYPEAQANLGASLADHGQREQAILHLQQAAQLGFRRADMHYLLGQLLAEQKQWLQSRAALETALEMRGQHLQARALLAKVLLQLGEQETARDHARQALHQARAAGDDTIAGEMQRLLEE